MNDESDIQNILFPVIRDKFEFRKSEALEDLNISKFQEVGRLNFDETDENRDERVRQVWPVTQFFCFFLFCKNNNWFAWPIIGEEIILSVSFQQLSHQTFKSFLSW